MEISGGQALLGGVSLRSAHWRVAARRGDNGAIAFTTARATRASALETPFVRAFVLWFLDSPTELEWAAAELEKELLRQDSGTAAPAPSATPIRAETPLGPSAPPRPLRVLMAMVFACVVPEVVTDLLLRAIGVAAAPSTLLFTATMLAVSVALASGYLLVVRALLSDLRDTFGYNAAVKMALWAAYDDAKATVKGLRRYPSWHYRSNLIAYLPISAVIAIVPALLLAPLSPLDGGWVVKHGVMLAARLLLLPAAVVVVDEGLRALARHGRGTLARAAFAPFAWFDALVTRAPSDDQIAVAAFALRELRRLHSEERVAP